MRRDAHTNRYRAVARYQRVSPQKARLVLDAIRHLPVEQALDVLRSSPKKAARVIEQVLDSAIANAQNVHSVFDVDELIVAEGYADQGPSLKRWRPRAQGRATRILKRTSHITIVLAPASRSARA